jgi:hypothetical protein
MRGFRGWATFCAGLLTVFAMVAGTASAADPVVNPGNNFAAMVTGGQIKIGTDFDPIDVSTMTPSPKLKNITVNPDGSFSALASDFVFPEIILPVDVPVVGTKDIHIQIRAASPVAGNIDPATGEISLTTSLTIQLTGDLGVGTLGSNCYVGPPSDPIPFSGAGGAAKGVPYDEYAGTATILDDTAAIPGATGCPTILGQNVNSMVNSTLGLPSPSGANSVSLELRLNPAPHSEDWVDPNGPGHIDPVIVNDSAVTSGDGLAQRSWLESFAISNDRDQGYDDGDTGGSALNRAGNTVRVSVLIKHDVGREVTGLKIDDDWNGSDDSDSVAVKPVTEQQPDVAGGFNYSRVSFEYQAPEAGMGLSCPGLLGGDGTLGRSSQISLRAVLDDGSETESSVSGIRLTRADCNGHNDPPMIYGWQAPDPAGPVTPGTPVTFSFRGDDTDDSFLTGPNQVGGYTWRARNLNTGTTGASHFVCAGSNIDNALRTITVNSADMSGRGRWVIEAQLHNLNGPTANDCNSNEFGANGRPWYWVGAVDVNSPADDAGTKSPSADLSVPFRPSPNPADPHERPEATSLTGSVATSDQLDIAHGGKTQSVEWDLDGDAANGVDGFETVRLGDSRDGLSTGQNQITFDTTDMAPGIYPIRVRVGDNGALGAADDIRRTNIAESQFMVNTPPTAEDLSVTTDQGNSVATILVASDTNADDSHDPLTWSLKTPPANGFLSGEWPNRAYHPDPGFSGTDTFVYEVNDGFGGIASGTVTVTVKPVGGPTGPTGPTTPTGPTGPEKQALKASFDEGRINLNEGSGPGTSGVKVVDSTVPDPPVVFDTKHWDKSTGEIEAPASDLTFPAKTVTLSITDPLPLDLNVTIEFGALGKIGGSFNASTGALNLDFDAHALITVAADGLGQVLKCDVTPIPLQLSTAGGNLVDPGNGGDRPAATWKAKAFDSNGDGAVTNLWNGLPASTTVAELMPSLASCNSTLDGLIGGKGGFWLGGKVTYDKGSGPDPDPDHDGGTKPNKDVATFDGKHLFIRLYCPKVFKPKCKTTSVPVTKKISNKASRKAKKKAKQMAKPIKVKIKSGKWKKVSYLIKPKFRAKVQKMVGKKKRLLVIKDTVKAKKLGKKKMKERSRTFFHRHKVRAG